MLLHMIKSTFPVNDLLSSRTDLKSILNIMHCFVAFSQNLVNFIFVQKTMIGRL